MIPQLTTLGLRDEDKVIRQQPRTPGNIVFRSETGIDFAQVDDQGVFDAEDGVGGFVGVVTEVESPIFIYKYCK
jgi:hypothetical protein